MSNGIVYTNGIEVESRWWWFEIGSLSLPKYLFSKTHMHGQAYAHTPEHMRARRTRHRRVWAGTSTRSKSGIRSFFWTYQIKVFALEIGTFIVIPKWTTPMAMKRLVSTT